MNIIENNLKFGSMNTRTKTDAIILHHSACSSCSVEQIHQWHINNGWAGIGYHFLVRKDGSIYRGRSENKVGAHASNHNSTTIGICAEGNFEIETMSEAQKNSLKELVASLKSKYAISKVQKHSDVNSTACPGKNYPFNEIANGEVPQQSPTTPTNQNVANIQSWINSTYGYGISIDNKYGNDTHKHMVMALQTELNRQCGSKLVIDGIFGSATKSACPTLKNGMSGNITKLVQSMLVIKGYSIESYGIDGRYGSSTINAVKQFQSNSGLSSDGLCGKNTFEKLFR